MFLKKLFSGYFLFLSLIIFAQPTNSLGLSEKLTSNEVDFWLTKSDSSVTFEKQATALLFTTNKNEYPSIEIDATQTYQSIDGFGFTLTGGSVAVINQLSSSKKQELLQTLFGSSNNAISTSYLRISIGASDLNSSVFTYNDLPPGKIDLAQKHFSIKPDRALVTMLQEILKINPTIKIMAVPWSAPLWMKTKYSSVGGNLNPDYYESYAAYFVKYIKAMRSKGIGIDAVCPQNEPEHGGNNPSMLMTAKEQIGFIKKLGVAFKANRINTKIISYDHNCDHPEYPIEVLSDPEAYQYTNGSAFHLYAGDISALSTVHNAFPNKDVYFTEQWISSSSDFSGDLKWHTKNVIIGSMRNWSKIALEWNLANDPSFGPHTDGGCTMCKGAITINDDASYSKNVGYYIIAHASKFIPTGSVRIGSSILGNLSNVAFKTPTGKKVLLVENDSNINETFNIKYNNKWVTVSLEGGAVGSFIW